MRFCNLASKSLALVVWWVAVTGCGPGESQTGTQTNWLRSCQSSSDCGPLSCLCGVCTQTCDDDLECSELPGASCLPAEASGTTAMCGGSQPDLSGMCLSECPLEGCAPGSSCVAGVCTPTLDPTAQLTLDESTRFQTLDGIGAAVAYVNDEVVGHPRVDELLDVMFLDSGFYVLRLRNRYAQQDDDLTSTERIVSAATERLGTVPTIILNLASPPQELKANGSPWCEGNPDTCTLTTLPDGGFDYSGFADHWRSSLEAYAASQVEPDYISIQNNPNWVPAPGTSTEACRFLPSEGSSTERINGEDVVVSYPGYVEALNAVQDALADLPEVPKFIAPETSSFASVLEYTDELDMANIDALALHMYGTDPARPDTDLLGALAELATENQRPLFQSEMQEDALGTARLIHAAFANAGASLFVHNGFIGSATRLAPDDTVLINLTDEEFVVEAPYHVLRHYAAYTSPGWVRVDASTDASSLMASAWLSPEQDALAIVLTNPELARQVVELDVTADDWTNSSVTRTSLLGVERSQDLGELPPDRRVVLPAQSLVTVALER